MSPIPVVIPAAGLGVRLARITGGAPKELLLLAGEPVLLGALLEVAAAGPRDVVVVTTARKPRIRFAVEQLIADHAELRDLSVAFVDQPEPRGVFDAVDRAAAVLEADRLVVLFPDYVNLPDQTALAALLTAAQGLPPEASAYLVMNRPEAVAARHGPTACVSGELDEGLLAISSVGSLASGAPRWHTTFAEVQGTAHRARIAGEHERNVLALLQDLAAAGQLFGVPAPGDVVDVGIPAGHADAVARFTSGEARWRTHR